MILYPFNPSATANFQFQPTLDGKVYNVIITWNLGGARYYVNIYTLQGARVLTIPLIGSPPDYDLNLIAGYFASTMVFRASSQNFEVVP